MVPRKTITLWVQYVTPVTKKMPYYLLSTKPYIYSEYEEDTPALVDNLVPAPDPALEEKKKKKRKTKDKPAGKDKAETDGDTGEDMDEDTDSDWLIRKI